MLVVLMVFCAVGAVLLIGLSVYADIHDLSAHSGKRDEDPHPSIRPYHR